MKLNQTITLHTQDILDAVRMYLQSKGIDPNTVCGCYVHEDRDGETKYDHIRVTIQEKEM